MIEPEPVGAGPGGAAARVPVRERVRRAPVPRSVRHARLEGGRGTVTEPVAIGAAARRPGRAGGIGTLMHTPDGRVIGPAPRPARCSAALSHAGAGRCP